MAYEEVQEKQRLPVNSVLLIVTGIVLTLLALYVWKFGLVRPWWFGVPHDDVEIAASVPAVAILILARHPHNARCARTYSPRTYLLKGPSNGRQRRQEE